MAQVTYSFEGGTNGSNVAAGSGAATGDTNFDAIFNTSATNVYDNTHAAHGTLSNKIATSATSTSSYVSWTTSIGTQTTVWVRTYLFFTAAPAVQHRVVNFVGSASSRGNILATTSGTLIFTNAGGGTVLTSAAFPTNAWFRLEAMFTGSATVGQWEYKIWNTPDSSGTPDDTQTSAANLNTGGTCDNYRFGIGAAVANAGPFWQDDVGVDTTAYIGPVVTSIPWAPPRYLPAAPPGPAPVEQRPYRSIPGAVDTPANPLPSPLDSAWQAGAAYWHAYGDTAARDRRAYFQQRPLVSDPNLLAGPAQADPTLAAWASLQVAYGMPSRWRTPPPQPAQWAAPDVDLTTALLENELLGGAGTGRHYLAAAYTDRREVPQQRLYISDPSFYPVQAQVGAGTTEAWWGADTDAFYKYQRLRVSDPNLLAPPVPFDPTLGGQDDLGRRARQAATHTDRREVPQQRPYISDPSFYPTVAPADPLTLAWGAGGAYWHAYNRAADVTDRREVPQQRAYISDPLLLTTAQLENELLGGAGTGRHYTWHTDRRLYPQQRAYFAAVDLPLDPTLAAWNDLARRYLAAATHAGRRLYPQQRLYFPLPPPPPPFTVGALSASDGPLASLGASTTAGGSGGVLTASDIRLGGPG